MSQPLSWPILPFLAPPGPPPALRAFWWDQHQGEGCQRLRPGMRGQEISSSPNPRSRAYSGPWHRVERSARPQRSEDVSPGEQSPTIAILRGCWARPRGARPGSLKVSAGTLQRMTGPGAPASLHLPSPLHRPVAGSSAQNIRGQAVLWMGSLGVSGRPQDPRASRLPARPPRATPGPLLARYSPISGSGREGNGLPAPRSPRAQSSARRMAAPPGAGRGQQVLGRAPRSRGCRVGFSHLAARRSHRPLPSSSHLAQSPAPPRSPAPGKAPPPQCAGSQRSVDPALDRDCRTAHPALHSHFRLLCRMGAEARSDLLKSRACTRPWVKTPS